ncbi:MAG: choloylglycine hydrolase [Coriobacteriales bacterium]
MCTAIRFNARSGGMYFGRNLDWECGYGEHPVIAPRGWEHSWEFDDTPDGHKAVIGIGITAQDTPLYFDCMNEDGLGCAGLFFAGFASYEDAPVQGKVNLASYELPLWVCRNFSTVKQARAALENATVVGVKIAGMEPSALHWIIADAAESIVVEYTASGMHIYSDPVDTLANQPAFDWHLENLRSYYMVSPQVPQATSWGSAELEAYGTGGGMRALPGDYYSTSRFVRAAYLNAHYPQQEGDDSNKIRLFRSLQGVAMVEGASLMKTGNTERTIYTSGYSAQSKTLFHSTYEDPAISSWSLDDYDLSSGELMSIK